MMAIRIFSFSYILKVVKQKVKQSRYGLEGYRKLRFPDFMTTAQDGW